MSDLYRELILEQLSHPHCYGQLEDWTVQQQETNSSCGDQVLVGVKLDQSGKNVVNIGWTGNGCAISQAAMSLLAESCVGKSISEIQNLTQKDIEALLGLDTINPGRKKCLLLGLKALHKALKSHPVVE